jgi:hypothetical protein
MEDYRIPLRNKNKEIVGYTLVDKDIYEKIKDLKFSYTTGYARNSKLGLLHRYIMSAKKHDPLIDHINNDKLDNRRENLRFSNKSQNGQNKLKKENTESKYIGVSKDKLRWVCKITYNGKQYNYSFYDEIHAAYYYDKLAVKYHGPSAKINNVSRPENFYEPIKYERELPKGIYTLGKKFRVRFCTDNTIINVGTYPTLEEAIKMLNETEKEIISEKENDHYLKEIKRNNDGIAIIEIKNIHKKVIKECLIDDDNYHELIRYSWAMNKKYVQTNIDGKVVKIHRLILNAKENEIVDHINHNPLDNRKNNIRIVDESINSHNKIKKLNSMSKFMGVTKIKKTNKYCAKITKDGICYNLGYYILEAAAAEAYNKKAIELYGSFANLNILTNSS